MTRRKFLQQSSMVVAGVGGVTAVRVRGAGATARGGGPCVIATWPFGKPANEEALRVLAGGGSVLDAVEHGIRLTEADATNKSVGLGGLPNAAGVVQLDACIMAGAGHRAGSVAALEGIRHPISVARRVMEQTPHVMLVGEGARMFALEQGFAAVADGSEERYEAWRKRRAGGAGSGGAGGTSGADARPATGRAPVPRLDNHDTIALLVLGADGALAGGCSTSGWGGKLPGRVGDSPILGSGLYVDSEVGAAGATGLGENVMRYCGSFQVVELMRQGMTPEEACLEVVRRIVRKDPKGSEVSINFIALDREGRFGGAGSAKGFEYAVARPGVSRVLKAPAVGVTRIGPEGGNRR